MTTRITNLRIAFRHHTVPIHNITCMGTDVKVTTLGLAFIAFMLSFLTLFVMPYYGILLIFITFVILYRLYSTYIGLWVKVGDRKLTVINTSIANSKYVYKLADILGDAITDNERARALPDFDITQTMKLKEMIQEYDRK